MKDTTIETFHVTRDTPLYWIQLLAPIFPLGNGLTMLGSHGRQWWRDVKITIVRQGKSPHTYEWASLLDLRAYGSNRPLLEDTYYVLREGFSEQEKDLIAAWLGRQYPECSLTVKRMELPNCYSSADAAGGDYYYFEEPGCPFDIQGHYILEGCQPFDPKPIPKGRTKLKGPAIKPIANLFASLPESSDLRIGGDWPLETD
jgi:hypothetical protein